MRVGLGSARRRPRASGVPRSGGAVLARVPCVSSPPGQAGRCMARQVIREYCIDGTSTSLNFYTGLKFMSKTHFYGRIAAEGILAIIYENRPFYGRRAAEAIFSV